MKTNSQLVFNYLKMLVLTITLTFLPLACSSSEPGVVIGTVTDIDGHEYQTVKIGNQWWMVENLRVTHYRNGVLIPNISEQTICSNQAEGAYNIIENDSSTVETFGLLYNWFAVDDEQGVCPESWHVPSDKEWKALERHLGMSKKQADETEDRGTDEGGKLKETGTKNWQDPNSGATNESGFTALPGGGRACYSVYDGQFSYKGQKASFWTSTEDNSNLAWFRNLDNDKAVIIRKTMDKHNGISIRCVED